MHGYSTDIVKKFRGTGVALVTPFRADNSIDTEGLEKLIHHVIDGGVEYVVSMGTTGESVTLTEEERFAIIDFTVKTVNGRAGVVAGFGGNNTMEIIHSIQKYHFIGVDAILSTSPYYNKPGQEGIYRHYMALDAVTPVPLILYNVPGRTSSNMEASTTVRIAKDAEHVIGIKEASGNFVQCMKIIRDKPENFIVISGDDVITLPFISIGMEGVISVIANAFPKEFSGMVRAALDGDSEKALKLHYLLVEITELIFKEGSPAGVKYVLKQQNICDDYVRLPLWGISESLQKNISAEMQKINAAR